MHACIAGSRANARARRHRTASPDRMTRSSARVVAASIGTTRRVREWRRKKKCHRVVDS
jgi:hypothetical protein